MATAPRGKAQLPVNYQEQLAREAAEIAKRIAAPTGDRIRFNSNRSLITPDGSEGETLEVVVIDFLSTNLFYDGPFDRDNPQPPGCFAIGAEPSLMVPSPNSPNRQAETCSSCPNNQFGSAPNGKGKACKNTRVLAVLPPEADETTPLWLLNVSPTAIKGFDGFVGAVQRTFEMPPIAVVVEVDFNPAETFASLTFSNPQPNQNLAAHFARQEEARQLLTVEPDVSSFGQAAPTKAPARPVARKPAVGARR